MPYKCPIDSKYKLRYFSVGNFIFCVVKVEGGYHQKLKRIAYDVNKTVIFKNSDATTEGQSEGHMSFDLYT